MLLKNRIGGLALIVVFFALIGQMKSQGLAVKGLQIIKSDNSELILSYQPHIDSYEEIITDDGITTLSPRIPGTVTAIGNPGDPANLVLNLKISVPSPEGFSLVSATSGSKIRKNGLITPIGRVVDMGGLPGNEYKVDRAAYNKLGSNDLVTLEYAGIARNRHIAELKINAAVYNPSSASIEIPEIVNIHIKFDGPTNPVSTNSNNQYDLSGTINNFAGKSWLLNNSAANRSFNKKSGKSISQVSNNWVKIRIDKQGVYRISASMLSSLGINLSSTEVNSLKLYTNGGAHLDESIPAALENQMHEQEIIINTNGNGQLDEIVFYGSPAYGFKYDSISGFKHYINNYSWYNYYLLTWDGGPGKRAVPLENPQGDAYIPTTYVQREFFEEELYNALGYPGSGRIWYGRNIFPKDTTIQLPNLDPEGNIFYRFSVAHRGEGTGTFKIKESGKDICSINLLPVSAARYEGSYRDTSSAYIAASELSGGRSFMSFNYSNTAGVTATGYLDWYEIHYPRSFVAVDESICFYSNPDIDGLCEYTLSGFKGEITGFDITDPSNPRLLKNDSHTGGLFKFRNDAKDNIPKCYYLSSKVLTPQIEKTEFANLRTNNHNTDVIIVTHPDFIESADGFGKYRSEKDGLSYTLVTTEQIFNEFGGGIPDPTALRDFFAHTMEHWDYKPRYIVLWGDGHYDFKNVEYKDKANYIPPYESFELSKMFDHIDSHTKDDYFVRVVGDDRFIDIPIGRLPVDSPENGMLILNKIKHYENNSAKDMWRSVVTLLADDSPSGNNNDQARHTNQSEVLSRDCVPMDMLQNKIYLVEYPVENVPGGKRKPTVTEKMLTTINTSGTLILNWVGHGNPRVWAHEEILERGTSIPRMTNIDKLFFLTAPTCDFARFDIPDIQSGAEELILNDHGGSIGVFAASRVVFSGANAAINEAFYSELFDRDSTNHLYKRLGDVYYLVKQYRAGSNDERFFLLGDPTMRLQMPENKVVIETINKENVLGKDDTLKLRALQEVSLTGYITDKNDQLDETFNGIVLITMLDGDDPVEVTDSDNSQHFINKHGGALNRSSYKVVDGRFTASFIIPKDISYSEYLGRLYAFGIADDERFAKGANRSYLIDGIDDTGVDDFDGPKIEIFLDARTFVPGDIVQSSPLLIVDLHDFSGINTTGMGIGHRIEAWIDDNPNAIDLTENFTTSLENSRSGSVETLLFGLEPGFHNIKVRAWDVYNNYSVAESYFRIAPEDMAVLGDLICYPNPMSQSATFRFDHNMGPGISYILTINSVNGRQIRTLTGSLNTLHTSEIPWDGLAENGMSISAGTYLVVLKVYNDDGMSKTITGIFSKVY